MATNSKFSADLGIKTDADLQVDGNVTVSGNLTVNGTQTTVNSSTTSVEDSMLELANANVSSDTLDIGIYGNYDDGLGDGVSEYTGFFRDASDSTWKLFDGLESEPTTTVNTSGSGYTLADLQVGDLTATTLTATNALTGSSITYPTSDGTNGQVLKTNGSGVLSFGDIPAGYSDSDARSAISVSGNLSYDSSTGVISYTTPTERTDAEVRGLISVSGDLSYNSSTGVISYSDSDTTYTDSDARSAISVSGNLAYDSSTGVISYTEPTMYADSNARSAISAGTGISYDSSTGVITNTVSNTDTTYSAGTGLTLSGTTFSSNITQYTDANARSAISAGTGISYNSSTGVITNSSTANGITTSGSNTIIQSPDDTNVIHVNNSANVGIGTSIANHKVNIHTEDDDDYALRIEGSTNNSAVWTGIGIAGEESNTKAAIIFKDIAQSYARGDLIFALNSSADQSNASPSDAKMTITNEGYITAPNQVAFSVAKNNGYQTDDNVFVCDSTTGSRNHNDGSHYNTSNGRFTAPVAGRYWFSFSVQTHDSGGVVQSWVALRKNGSIVQYNLQHKTGGYHTRFDMSISLKLAENDYIEAYVGESGTSSGWQGSASEYNNFSGFLIG